MGKRIAIVQGHPDPAGRHLCHALADGYAVGAALGGHEVRRIEIATLDFPILRSQQDFETGTPGPDIAAAQDTIRWAGHLVFVYPLWLGTMPALMKAFLEQAFRPDFALEYHGKGWPVRRLAGRSARILLTMGMPALAYRWYFGAHGLKTLERNILRFCGVAPVRHTLFGRVAAVEERKRRKWIEQVGALGRRGD